VTASSVSGAFRAVVLMIEGANPAANNDHRADRHGDRLRGRGGGSAPSMPQRLLAAAGAGSAISRANIYAGDLGVSAVAMLGRAVDRRAQIVVTAGWPDVGRA
jgi:hypothetical protein